MGAMSQEDLTALKDLLGSEIRQEVKDVVRDVLADAQKPAPPNPNADRFAEQAERVERKIGESLDAGRKAGYAPAHRFARAIQAYMAADRNVSGAMDFLKSWGDDQIRKDVSRAMELENPKYGGILVPEEYSMEIIELLRPASVLARAQPRRVGLRGKLHMAQKRAGSQSFWGDPRGRNRRASRVQLGMLTLDEKALTTIIAFPRRLAQLASVNITQFLLEEIIEEQGVAMDLAFFQGEGNQFQPLGYLNLPSSGVQAPNRFAVDAAVDWKLPITLRQKANEVNATMVRPAWFMPFVLETLLMTATPNSGTNPIWMAQMQQGTLLGAPYYATNHVPVAATSNNPTTLTYMDMAQYLLGQEGEGYEFAQTDVGGYYDEEGNVAQTFPDNEVAVRVIQRCDFGPRNPLGITIGTGVRTT